MHRTTTAAGAVLAAALATVLSSTTVLAPADAAPRHESPARASAYRVIVGVDQMAPHVHTDVTIKGSVSPAAPGSRVTIQVKYQDRKSWKSIGHATLSRQSRFRFTDQVDSVRERRYRAVMPAAGSRDAGSGTTPKVTVFGWRTLASVRALTTPTYRDVTMNGERYEASFVTDTSSPTPQGVWNLNRDCTELKGWFGLEDMSPTGSQATLSLTADGQQRYLASFGLAEAKKVWIDLTQVFRISIAGSASGSGVPAVGDPMVLCSF